MYCVLCSVNTPDRWPTHYSLSVHVGALATCSISGIFTSRFDDGIASRYKQTIHPRAEDSACLLLGGFFAPKVTHLTKSIPLKKCKAKDPSQLQATYTQKATHLTKNVPLKKCKAKDPSQIQVTYTLKVTHLTKNVPPQKSRIGNASRLEGDGAAVMRHTMEKYPPQKSRTGNVSRLEGDGAASMGHT